MLIGETWRLVYRTRRYLEKLNETELLERARDVLLNTLSFKEDSGPGLNPITGEGQYWMALWTHVLEEYALRDSFGEQDLRDELEFRWPVPTTWEPFHELVRANLPARPGTLFMYGSKNALEKFRDTGSLDLDFVDGQGMLRCSCVLKTRLFRSFDADACLALGSSRVLAEPMREISESPFEHGPVDYIDPVLCAEKSIQGHFRNHFRETYKHEYRFLWPSNTLNLGTGIDCRMISL